MIHLIIVVFIKTSINLFRISMYIPPHISSPCFRRLASNFVLFASAFHSERLSCKPSLHCSLSPSSTPRQQKGTHNT